MKINQGKSSESSPPYNEIYNAFAPFFLQLLEQRRVYSLIGDSQWYVPMPEIESMLIDFVKSGSSELCLFVGSIGTGKSSILRHLTSTSWKGQKDIQTVYLDLNRTKGILEALDLPADFILLDKAQQKQLAKSRINSYVTGEIESLLAANFDQWGSVDELYQFFWDQNREVLMQVSFFYERDTDERRRVLKEVKENNRISFLFVTLKYYALTRNLDALVILVDNCDQKDALLIEAFIEVLCHLDRCFESVEGAYDKLPRFIPVVSCRPATQWILEQNSNRNTVGSHGCKVICITQPCSLAALVARRFSFNKTLKEPCKDVRIVSTNGITWEFDRQKEFLEKLCGSLEKYHNGALILSLCNHNIADAVAALAEILSNRHFIDLDRVIGDVTSDDSLEIGFRRRDILRSLAYGNPQGRPLYPTRRTRLPNLLSGDSVAFPKSLLKPRIVGLLLNQREGHGAFWDVSELIELVRTYFRLAEAQMLRLLDEMFDQGLIESNRGYKPSEQRMDCQIASTPRARELWNELAQADHLISFYRDDLDLSNIHQHKTVPTFELDLSDRCSEMLTLADCAVKCELEELRFIHESALIAGFRATFGATMVSEIILLGLTSSVYKLYKRYMNFWPKHFETRLSSISENLVAGKLRLGI